ncbi:uncharacterized protein LOC9630164 [Selaginella moellendorffii]|uniref:uncharacterized protein LOC9630164 n=1 Tax=Selaginella moellendorffii TaxID=88036 RepID=UPI000D1CE6D3|nr:uncharacterized protein LOC9630164 [Selaginella moellendorffii]|eukprot:XP_024522037.1 uncharacterized protein LOC9630164 [Selaginella moellendorffii]
MGARAPSLQELCIHTAIDNLHRFGDVGDTDLDLLRIILPHCTTDQLRHIENCSKDRDLAPVTNELWKKCYGRDFGPHSLELVESKLKHASKSQFKWRDLYERNKAGSSSDATNLHRSRREALAVSRPKDLVKKRL